jgi:hypothetical protein
LIGALIMMILEKRKPKKPFLIWELKSRIYEKYSCFKTFIECFGGIIGLVFRIIIVLLQVFSVGYDYSYTGLSSDFL